METTARSSSFGKSSVLRTSFRSALISFVISLILVLIFAFVVKLTSVSDTIIGIVNQVIKVLSVFLGVLFGLQDRSAWFLKGLLSGIFFALISFGVFGLLGANLTMLGLLGDLGISVVAGIVGALLSSIKKIK